MKALSKLYTANANNEVIVFSTNLKDFSEALSNIEANAEPYHTLRRRFEKNTLIPFVGTSGINYILQEVFNSNKINLK